MLDLTLKTPDAATMKAALTAAGLWDAVNDKPVTASHQHSLDVAGTLYAPDGTTTTDAQGNVVPVQRALDGYFAFLRVLDDASPLPALLNAVIIDQPATTLREFAGGSYKGPVYWDPDTAELYTE